jgi:TetR/AcrR family transcriptional regulator, mexJK operon transcriptional repressor
MAGVRGREIKRRRILEVARRLFLERGFDGTTTDAITGQSHVSKETLYRWYRGKEELLVAVMREMTFEQVLAPDSFPLPQVRTREDLEASLVRLAGDALDRLMEPDYLALCRLAFAESGRRPELVELFRRSVPEAGARVLTAFLAAARERGLLRPDLDVTVAARLLVGPLLTWALTDGLMAVEAPVRPPREALVEVVRLFLDGTAATHMEVKG